MVFAAGYYIGVDVGSLSCDSVLIDEANTVLSSIVVPTGVSGQKSSETALKALLQQSTLEFDQIKNIVSTGYGRERVDYAHKAITEITCHGKGATHLFPDTTIVIDIGGQDSKAIRVTRAGKILDFVMNDRCAAGTGRFLEVMARALEIELIDLGPISTRADKSCPISSMCTVFAESEVISLLASGNPVDQIVRGIHEAVARRTMGLVQRLKPKAHDVVTLSGGVAHNQGMVAALQKFLDMRLNVPAEPQLVGALGAALLAREKQQ
ncbi:2-hydroxyglutaryl-CoA dehydratase [bacterium]|nr:2-hydroxyglutaryl-CoA dehydratase [bacterium]